MKMLFFIRSFNSSIRTLKLWNQGHVWSRSLFISGKCDHDGRKKANFTFQGTGKCLSSYVSPSNTTFHFDTHKMVSSLEENGYTKQQSEAMTVCLLQIVGSCVSSITSVNASKLDQERLEMKLKTSINEIKNEVFLLEKSKFSQIKEDNQRLKDKVKAMESLLVDEVTKLKSYTRLDLSLEKSQTREELAIRDQKIKDNANKIETEIAKLGTLMETQKLDLIKYLVGSLISISTITLAIWRFLRA